MSTSTAKRAWARQRAGKPYRPGGSGWLVVSTMPATETRRAITSYWFGPGHGWGNTWGPLSPPTSARVWPTKVAAEAALRSVFGSPSQWRGNRPVRVAEAEGRT